MSNTVSVRFRSFLPGSGRDANGNPAQAKQRVTGSLSVTSAAAGESLTPTDLGLKTIDHIDLQVQTSMGSKSGRPRLALYDYGSQEFYVLEDNSTAQTAGNTYTVRFDAFGDSALAPELS